MGHSIFKADYPLMIQWFNRKGYSGSLNEMIISYFRSKLGSTALGYPNDLVATYLRQQGYSGDLGGMLNTFFCNKAGISDPLLAQRLFFGNSANDFTSFVTFISGVSAGSINFSSVTTNAINTTGANLIVIAGASGGASTITDSKSNTWTALTARTDVGTGQSQLFYCFNPTVGSGHTFTNTQVAPAISVMAFSNSIAFDVQNGSIGATVTTLSTGSVTPSFNNCLVVSGLEINGAAGAVWTIDSGFTANTYIPDVGGSCVGCGMAYKIQTTATAVNPAWSGGSATGAAATIATFKNG